MRMSDWSSDVCSSDLVGQRNLLGDRVHVADELLVIGNAALKIDHPVRAKRIVRRAQHALAGRDLRLEPIDRRLQVRHAAGLRIIGLEAADTHCSSPDVEHGLEDLARRRDDLCAGLIGLLDAAEFGRFPLEIRSEEHTSELQSLMRISYAVFCLKKK